MAESEKPDTKRAGRGNRRGRSATDSKALEIETRRVKVYELRLRGRTIREIAADVGVSRSIAHADVVAVLDRIKAEANDTAEQVRQLEIERLDKMLDSFWQRVLEGDEKAADVVLKVQARRSKLLGLDAPEQHSVEASVTQADPATAARLVREAFGEKATPRDAGAVPLSASEE